MDEGEDDDEEGSEVEEVPNKRTNALDFALLRKRTEDIMEAINTILILNKSN